MEIFALFSDYTFLVVATASALLGITSGVLGSFAVLRKQSLLGDGISHATLPGVVMAFLLTGNKNTEVLLLGALITGLLALFCISYIIKNTRVKFDAALALVLSVFFGVGMILLTLSQKIPNANQAGLDSFIYGQASSILKRDEIFLAICSVCLLSIVAILWKEFKLVSFDPDFAKTIGLPVTALNLLLNLLIVIAIIIGLQTVGVILMSAMLIAPAVAARQWTNKLWKMVFFAAFISCISSVLGTMISSSVSKLSTGPVIVVCVSVISIVSILFAPKRGVIFQIYQRHLNKINFAKIRRAENE